MLKIICYLLSSLYAVAASDAEVSALEPLAKGERKLVSKELEKVLKDREHYKGLLNEKVVLDGNRRDLDIFSKHALRTKLRGIEEDMKNSLTDKQDITSVKDDIAILKDLIKRANKAEKEAVTRPTELVSRVGFSVEI